MSELCCFSVVQQQHVKVIEKFGRYVRMAQPGCITVCWPFGERVAGTMSLRLQQLDTRCETKTRDNVFVNLVVAVQYQVIKEAVYDAFYKLTDSRQQITAFVFDVVRATVPKMNLDDVFLAKEEIAHSVKEELTKSMTMYGYSIMNVLVTDIDPAAKVKAAMNDINAAQRLRMAAVEQAEAQKITVVKAAEADAEAKYLAGQGIARQRQAIVNGLRESVVGFSNELHDINSRDVIEMMLLTQYVDMLKDVGTHGKSSTVFLNSAPGSVKDFGSQIREGFIQAQASAPSLQTASR